MGTALALISAALYGIVDFVGGRVARQINGVVLALYVQISGLVAMLLLAPALPGTISPGSILWGSLSGLGSGIAIMFLYTGMGKGKISLVVPLAAVVGAGIPVLVGLLVLGERPSAPALFGVALVLPSIWLVAGGLYGEDGQRMAGFADSLLAGLGVAAQYAAIAQAPTDSGIWPLVANRAASIVIVFAYGRVAGATFVMPRTYACSAIWLGAAASVSLALYLGATRLSMLVISVVLASLYPVIPTLLAIWILRERVTGKQKAGLLSAAIAVGLIAWA